MHWATASQPQIEEPRTVVPAPEQFRLRAGMGGRLLHGSLAVAAVLLMLAGPATAAPAARQSPPTTVGGGEPTVRADSTVELRQLNRRAAAIRESLAAATKQYEDVEHRLAVAVSGLQLQRVSLEEATTSVARHQQRVADDAATAYRLGMGSALAEFAGMLQQDNAHEAASLSVYLRRRGADQDQQLERLQQAQDEQARRQQAADTELEQVGVLERQLKEQAERLRQQAYEAAAELAAELQRVSRARAAEEAAARARAAADRVVRAAAEFDAVRAWGGYPNGLIPETALCPVGSAHRMRCDAAAAFGAMSTAYALAYGQPLCLTDSYRSYPAQIDVYQRKPSLAALPGTSNHGWGLAADLCGGAENFGSDQHEWLLQHAPTFGWGLPAWAQPGGGRPEPWHWEYVRP